MIVANDATVKGGTYYPDDGEEASARAGDRRGRTACPASIWSIAAAPTCRTRPRSSPTATISAASSSTRRNMSRRGHPADRLRHGQLHRRRRLCAGDVRRDGDRPQPGHDLPRRPAAGEGRDRRGDLAPRSWAAPTLHGRKSGVVDHVAENDEHALTIVRDIVAHLGTAKHVDIDLQPSRARRSSTRRSSTASSPSDVRAPYDVREVIARHRRRQRVPRVQGALRHDAGLRLRAYLGHAGRDPRQQRRAVLRKRAEGRAFHRARLPAPHPAAVPAEHLGLHGRRQIRGRRHRQARRQAGHRGRHRERAQDHRADRRQLRRRQLRHVRPRLFARASCSPGPTAGSA